jgi:hypothetical protein
MGGKFTTTNLMKRMCFLGNFIWITVMSHQAHMIQSLAMEQDLLGELGIIMKLNDQTFNWDDLRY